jgi:hypothetical protein
MIFQSYQGASFDVQKPQQKHTYIHIYSLLPGIAVRSQITFYIVNPNHFTTL